MTDARLTRWEGVTAILIGMVLVVVIALVVISIASAEPEEDWTVKRPGRQDPDEGNLDDFLG